MALEDAAKVSCSRVDRRLHRELAVRIGFELQTGNFAIRNAAWNDPLEVAKVGGHIEREAVRGDALRDVDADGSDLLLLNTASGERPDACAFAYALGHHAEVAAGADEDLFEHSDEVDGAKVRAFFAREVPAQIDDGIADELAGAVISNVSAAVDLVKFDAALLQEFVRGEDVGAAGVAAQGKDWGMFEQQERIADEVLLTCGDDLLLDSEAFGVGNTAEMEKVYVH